MIKKTQGFTVIEVLVAVIIFSLTSLLLWVPEMEARVRDLHRIRADVTVEEIRRLGIAAQMYALEHNGEWPDLANQCRGSMELLELNYMDVQSPFHTGEVLQEPEFPGSLHGQNVGAVGEYTFVCSQSTSQVGKYREWIVQLVLDSENVPWAAYMANQFAGAQYADAETHTLLEVSTILPGAIPAFDAYLPRDGSEHMLGDLDMANNKIHSVQDVILDTGQTLASVPILHAVTRPGHWISKPACPQQYQPLLFLAPQSIAHAEGSPVTRFRVWATDYGDSWKVRSEVFSTSAEADMDNASAVLIQATVKCSL